MEKGKVKKGYIQANKLVVFFSVLICIVPELLDTLGKILFS